MRPSAAGWSMAGPSRTRASAALVLLCLPLVAAAGWGLGGGDDDDASIARAARRTVREAFVKNLNGTSFAEVSAITNVVPLGVATRHAIDAMRGVRTTPGGVAVDARGNPLRAMPMVCLDFVCVVLPALAAMLAPAVALPTLFAVGCAAILAATRARARRRAIHAGGDDARSDDGFNDVVATSPRRSFLARFPGPWYRPPPRSADEQSSRRPSALPLGPLDVLGAPRPYLAAYRAAMTLTTAVAILAVDFSAFPRRLAKTDSTRGVGLMDVGSGSFVLANALASRVARGLTTSSPSWWFAFWKRASVDVSSSNAHAGGGRDATNDATGAAPPERAHTIARTLRSTRWWSLIFLACARGLATHAMDYQQPVGEYGRHWNFFATLAVVDLCATATPLPPAFSSFAGLAILVAHQTSLLRGASPSGAGAAGVASSYGEYLLRDVPRGEGLLEQNKEGVGSIPGYVALYFLGAGLGRFVERSLCDAAKRASIRATTRALREATEEEEAAREAMIAACTAHEQRVATDAAETARAKRDSALEVGAGLGGYQWAWRWLLSLAVADAAFWAAAMTLHARCQAVSRRTANAAYCAWMLAFNLQVLLAFIAAGLLFPATPPVPKLLAAVNRRLLPTFLVANLLTGAVNGAMDTIHVGTLTAWASMVGYLSVVCVVGLALDTVLSPQSVRAHSGTKAD